MPRPLVSCIVPTRDRVHFVTEAIASAKSQNYCPVEILVVDDGSKDGTAELLAGIEGLRVFQSEGRGVAAARNLALENARGAYVAFLDSDDRWHPKKLETQVALMERQPELALTFTGYTVSVADIEARWRVDATRLPPENISLDRLLSKNFIGALTVMVRRDLVVRVGGFDTSFVRGSDYDLWLRVAAEYPIAGISLVLADYRWHKESLTRACRVRNATNYLDVISVRARSHPHIFDRANTDPVELLAKARIQIAALESEAV